MIANRAQNIPPFIVMDVLEKAQELERAGHRVIHLEVGEPDFDTPECIKKAAFKTIAEGKTHYTHSLGIWELRKAIANYYGQQYDVVINPNNVIITTGTSAAMFLIFASLIDVDDEVILPDPHYACYPNFVTFLGGKPVFVPVREEKGFVYDFSELKKSITSRTKAIVLNSPANPTGAVMPPELMQQIADLGITIVSDEIYHGLVYEGQQHSILEFTDNAFVINGFSKAYAMTGWRLGYIIAPNSFVRPIQKMQQNFFICAPSISQYAAIAALRKAQPDVAKMRATYNQRRLYMLETLQAMGFEIPRPPQGAFYFFVNVKRFSNDSYKLAFDILQKAAVAVTPGIDFGKCGEGFLRLSYATSLDNIKEGLNRLKAYFENYGG